MDNVVEFGKKPKPTQASSHMFTLDMYMTSDGEFEVYMEVDKGQSEETIFEGMIAAAMKYATDHDLHEDCLLYTSPSPRD